MTAYIRVQSDFSFKTRAEALRRFENEIFDVLVIGGGITGAAVARDAASRGLTVALVEKRDFAWGTSSRSSKLIHGGLRYLENLEFSLVFEALSERSFLLKTAPNRVRPLPFYFPVYRSDAHGMGIMSLGFWLYDFLALFRTPGFHKRLSIRKLLEDVPFLKREELKGGFRYFDASMWDDSLTIETLASAQRLGAAVANYVEAVSPIWQDGMIRGFKVRETSTNSSTGSVSVDLRAHKVIVCAGPWTDVVGQSLSPTWRKWLKPSKGMHLVFDHQRIPVPGAVVMSHPKDGRISFVIPRPDYGAGVTIVGTTDGPTPENPEKVEVAADEVTYLMDLLNRYFPSLHLKDSDILSSYVGVRPLFADPHAGESLQKVSREHHIDQGPGGTVVVAGGKYTTARNMGQEIMDFTLRKWRSEVRENGRGYFPNGVHPSATRVAINPSALPDKVKRAQKSAQKNSLSVPARLYDLYGADALEIASIAVRYPKTAPDPEGFPELEAVLRWSVRHELVMHLEDFWFRRVPIFMARADHGLPWLKRLAQILGEERGLDEAQMQKEIHAVEQEVAERMRWKKSLSKAV